MNPADTPAAAENERVLQGMFEFPHVSRPGISHEDVHHLPGNILNLPAELFPESLQEVLDQERNVFSSLTKRRHDHLHHIEPVVEVFPKLTQPDLLEQILVGRRNDPDIDANGRGIPDPFELFFLQDPEQAQLHLRRDVADLVQKYGALSRPLESPDLIPRSPGEGPFHVSEEFTFQEVFGECPAVHLDKGLQTSFPAVMQGIGNEFLARPALSDNEHRAPDAVQRLDEIIEALHRLAGSHKIPVSAAFLPLLALARLLRLVFDHNGRSAESIPVVQEGKNGDIQHLGIAAPMLTFHMALVDHFLFLRSLPDQFQAAPCTRDVFGTQRVAHCIPGKTTDLFSTFVQIQDHQVLIDTDDRVFGAPKHGFHAGATFLFFVHGGFVLKGPFSGVQEGLLDHGLGNVIESPEANRFRGRLDIGITGDHDDRTQRVLFSHCPQDIDPRLPAQDDV